MCRSRARAAARDRRAIMQAFTFIVGLTLAREELGQSRFTEPAALRGIATTAAGSLMTARRSLPVAAMSRSRARAAAQDRRAIMQAYSFLVRLRLAPGEAGRSRFREPAARDRATEFGSLLAVQQ